MSQKTNCEHWLVTVPVKGYGWVTMCEENCGFSESAEHTPACMERIYKDLPCICGAEQEYQKFLLRSGLK